MANVNIPLTSSDGVKKIYLEDYEKNFYKVKSYLVPPKKETEIGDIYEINFKPQIKIKRWDNDANLSVRVTGLPEGEETISTVGSRIKHRKGNMETRFHLIQEEEEEEMRRYEMDVVLYEKPISNKIQFTITSKNLTFYKQEALTQEEIDNGAERSEEVVGSYAVYHKNKKTNIWSNKKAMHIYRPKIWDATGNEIWGDIDINAEIDEQFGMMEITIDDDWLNQAIYPVTVDPTFGYTTGGSSTQSTRKNIATGNIFTTPQSGKVTKISAYLSRNLFFGNARVACYHSNQNLLGYSTSEMYTSFSPSWLDFTDGSGPGAPDFALIANDSYYLVVNNDNNNVKLHYDSLSIPSYEDPQTYGSWDDPAAFTAKSTRTYSIYATYIVTKDVGVSLSLGASKEILVKKRLENANIQLSSQYLGRFIRALVAINMAISVLNVRKSKKLNDVSAILLSDIEKKLSSIKIVIISLASIIFNSIRKAKGAIITISTNQSRFLDCKIEAVLYPSAQKIKKKIKKLKDVILSLSATSAQKKSVFGNLAIAITTTTNTIKSIVKTLSTSFQLSSDEDLINKQEFGASFNIDSNIAKRIAKSFSVSILLSSIKNIITYKIFDVILQLTSTESEEKEKTYETSTLLSAEHTTRVIKNRTVAITLLTTINKFVSRVLSAAYTLSSTIQRQKIKLLQADIALFVVRTILAKKLNQVTLFLSASPHRIIEMLSSVTMLLSSDINIKKVYKKIYDVAINVYSSVFKEINSIFGSEMTINSKKSKKMEIMLTDSMSLSGESEQSSTKMKSLFTSFSLNSSRVISVLKQSGAFILIEGADIKRIEGSATVQVQPLVNLWLTLTKTIGSNFALIGAKTKLTKKTLKAGMNIHCNADIESNKDKIINTCVQIISSLSVNIKKSLSASINFAGAIGKDIEGETEANFSLITSKQIIIFKEKEVIMTFVSSSGREIEGYANVPIDVIVNAKKCIKKTISAETTLSCSAEIASDKNEIFEVALSVNASVMIKVKKSLSGTITFAGSVGKEIEGDANTSITITAERKRIINKILSTDILLSGSSAEGSDKTKTLETSISLVSEKIITMRKNVKAFILLAGAGRKEIEATAGIVINLSSEGKPSNKEVFDTTIVLGTSVDIKRSGMEDFGITFWLTAQKARKRVGKTFTIREHTPSVWHNC